MALVTFLRPTGVIEWQAWCRDYERNTLYPVGGAHVRYSIGIYQIYQAIGWKDADISCGVDSKAEYESLASAATHFLMAAEAYRAPTELYLDHGLFELPYETLDCRALLYHISAAQQMIFYGYVSSVNDAKRSRSRFDSNKLAEHIAKAIRILVLAIPVVDRMDAFEDSTKIMTGRL